MLYLYYVSLLTLSLVSVIPPQSGRCNLRLQEFGTKDHGGQYLGLYLTVRVLVSLTLWSIMIPCAARLRIRYTLWAENYGKFPNRKSAKSFFEQDLSHGQAVSISKYAYELIEPILSSIVFRL
jgi:hypothetical protein